ncbi:MAG: Nif3-like dinuclear metal center hexameric protein, partial [Candidatus Krumholzibacteriota bacterium]|nr:Nif3-like dinuclear metal center hexameric protein [Candidatus Krumholzibacteriota bacterium]
TVGDVHDALDAIAPFRYAADWDNVGLLAGRRDWPVAAAMLAIDLTDAVAAEAISRGVNLLIVYHPPIFKGIKSVTPHAEGPTSLLPDLLAERIAIMALHTALDHAAGGTNDVLLDTFDTASRRPLQPIVHESGGYKLVVFVPAAEVDRLREALSAAGAGVIGNYSHCSFELCGRGAFIGDETTNPAVGRKQTLERVDEVRLEMVVPPGRVGPVVRALHANHSYEEPAFDLYPTTEVADRGWIGGGDVKLFAAIGAIGGFFFLFDSLFNTFLIAAVWGMLLLLLEVFRTGPRRRRVRLGAFIFLGALLCVVRLPALTGI